MIISPRILVRGVSDMLTFPSPGECLSNLKVVEDEASRPGIILPRVIRHCRRLQNEQRTGYAWKTGIGSPLNPHPASLALVDVPLPNHRPATVANKLPGRLWFNMRRTGRCSKLFGVPANMCVEALLSRKGLCAEGTHKEARIVVGGDVGRQGARPGKRFAAEVAAERPLAAVVPQVPGEVGLPGVHFAAKMAAKGPLAAVGACVACQVGSGDKGPCAEVACEGPLARVHLVVPAEGAHVRKGLAADSAAKGPLPRVGAHVQREVALSAKRA